MNYIVKITSGRFAGQFLSVGYGSSENYETWRSRVGGLVNAKELLRPKKNPPSDSRGAPQKRRKRRSKKGGVADPK